MDNKHYTIFIDDTKKYGPGKRLVLKTTGNVNDYKESQDMWSEIQNEFSDMLIKDQYKNISIVFAADNYDYDKDEECVNSYIGHAMSYIWCVLTNNTKLNLWICFENNDWNTFINNVWGNINYKCCSNGNSVYFLYGKETTNKRVYFGAKPNILQDVTNKFSNNEITI